jgi:hypothetical protein
MNLMSSTSKMGRYVTQIIHGVGGTKHTFHGIDTQTIKEGAFVKMDTRDGRYLLVNPKNVVVVEVFKEENELQRKPRS